LLVRHNDESIELDLRLPQSDCRRYRAIAANTAPPPIEQGFAGQLPECGREGSLEELSAAAIETTDSSVSRGIVRLGSGTMREPVLSLKARQSWKRDRPASEASAAG
jgi:hypothetical protein